MNPLAHTAIRSVTTFVDEARRTLGELAREFNGLGPYVMAMVLVGLVGSIDLALRTECRRLAAEIHAQERRSEELRELYRELMLDHSVRRGVEHLERAAKELGLDGARNATRLP